MYGGAVVVVVTSPNVTLLWRVSCLSTGWPRLALAHSLQCLQWALAERELGCTLLTPYHFVTLPASVVVYLMPCYFSILITDGVTCISLKGCKGNRVPAQLDHPSRRMGLWNLIVSAILSKVQMTPKEWVRWHLKPWVLRGSIEKSQGSKGKWVSFINIRKTTYCAGWGQRSMLLHCWGRGAPLQVGPQSRVL